MNIILTKTINSQMRPSLLPVSLWILPKCIFSIYPKTKSNFSMFSFQESHYLVEKVLMDWVDIYLLVPNPLYNPLSTNLTREFWMGVPQGSIFTQELLSRSLIQKLQSYFSTLLDGVSFLYIFKLILQVRFLK